MGLLGVTVALVVVVVSLLLLYSRWRHHYWQKRGVFSPPAYPFIGHVLASMNIGVFRWDYVHKIYMEKKSAKYFGMYEFMKPTVTVMDLELSQRVLIKDFDHFVDRPRLDLQDSGSNVLNDMLTNVTGSYWKGIRSVMTPTFTSGKMKQMFHLVQAKSKDLIDHCRRERDSNLVLELRQTFEKYTMDVIATCAFGMEINALKGQNSDFLKRASSILKPTMKMFAKSMLLLLFPWLFKKMRMTIANDSQDFLVDILKKTIEARKKGSRRGDFLDLMLDARESLTEEENQGKSRSIALSDNAIMAQSILFIIAGFDTTANTLSFAVHLIAKNRDAQERLRKELRERLETTDDGKLSYNDIMEDKYLDAVLAETLRLHSPAHVTQRTCTQDYTIPGTSLIIKEGQSVDIPIYSFHHDPEYFPDPMAFKPERFLPESKQDIPSGAYLPFGLGPRMCIAVRFAQMEAKLALAELVLNFDLSLAEGFEEIQYAQTPGIVRPKEDSMKIVFTDIEKVEELTA